MLIRSGLVVPRPLDQRTCSTIGSPTWGGNGHSALSTNGFHSPYDAVSSIVAHTWSIGAWIRTDADGWAITDSW
jgi:hypothetical protein